MPLAYKDLLKRWGDRDLMFVGCAASGECLMRKVLPHPPLLDPDPFVIKHTEYFASRRQELPVQSDLFAQHTQTNTKVPTSQLIFLLQREGSDLSALVNDDELKQLRFRGEEWVYIYML